MVEIEFNYNQSKTVIQANVNDQFKLVFNKFINQTNLDPNSICFLLNGNIINKEYLILSFPQKIFFYDLGSTPISISQFLILACKLIVSFCNLILSSFNELV